MPQLHSRTLSLIGGILLVGAVGIAAYYWPAGEDPRTRDWNVYRSETYNFEIRYPDGMNIHDGKDWKYQVGEFFATSGGSVVTAAFPDGSFPGTNYQHAFLTVAASANIESEVECAQFKRPDENAVHTMAEKARLGANQYGYTEVDGAAAGTHVTTRIFHVFREGTCYEVTMNLFDSNMGNFEPGAVEELPKNEVWDRLEQIASTMRFL